MHTLRLQKILIACICLAFLLRGLMPAGYMPDLRTLEEGGLKITLCTMDGPRQISLDLQGQPTSKPDSPKYKQICAFAGLSGPMANMNFVSADFYAEKNDTKNGIIPAFRVAFINQPSLARAPPAS